MASFFKEEKGDVLLFIAAAFFSLLLFGAMVTDLGYVLTARDQLQNAMDSAALAGAAGLLSGYDEATGRAIRNAAQNDCFQQPVMIGAENISFPAGNQITVRASHNLQLFFLRLIGITTRAVTVTASAELGYVTSTSGLAPWVMPRKGWLPGTRVAIKAGQLGEVGTTLGYFYPVAFPAVNHGDPVSGAREYEKNIHQGFHQTVGIGDILRVEPGMMLSSTSRGVRALLEADNNAYWDGSGIADSNYPEFSSPRIVKVALYDPNYPPHPGRSTIRVVGFAAFLVECMNGKEMSGVFLEITTTGSSGGGYSLLRCAHLL